MPQLSLPTEVPTYFRYHPDVLAIVWNKVEGLVAVMAVQVQVLSPASFLLRAYGE